MRYIGSLLGGCRKSDDGLQTGHLAIQLSAQDDIVDVTRSSISSITTLPADGDFTLTVKNKAKLLLSGQTTFRTFRLRE